MVAITAGQNSFAGFENDVKISFSESPIYYAALYDSTAVDSNNDEDEMDYSSEISGGEADW